MSSISGSTPPNDQSERALSSCSSFGTEMRSLYSIPPWSEIAEILIENSKQQFFFSDSGLLRSVHNIIIGKPLESDSPSSPTWDWDSD